MTRREEKFTRPTRRDETLTRPTREDETLTHPADGDPSTRVVEKTLTLSISSNLVSISGADLGKSST